MASFVELLTLEQNRVIANGGAELNEFSDAAVRGDVNTLESGMLIQVGGKVFKEPIRNSDRSVEYKMAKCFMTDEAGKPIGDPKVIKFYPSFLTKSVVEYNKNGERTGRIVSSCGAVVDAYKAHPSAKVGPAFKDTIEGKTILVKESIPVTSLRWGTTNVYTTHVYDFEYSDAKLPE